MTNTTGHMQYGDFLVKRTAAGLGIYSPTDVENPLTEILLHNSYMRKHSGRGRGYAVGLSKVLADPDIRAHVDARILRLQAASR